MELFIASIFLVAAGFFLVWRGRRGIATRRMSNTLRSWALTGITEVTGPLAVAAGWFTLIGGYIFIAVGSIATITLCIAWTYSQFSNFGSITVSSPPHEEGFTLSEGVAAIQDQRHKLEGKQLEFDDENLTKKNDEDFLRTKQEAEENQAAFTKELEEFASDLSSMARGESTTIPEANDPIVQQSREIMESLQSTVSEGPSDSEISVSLPGHADNDDSETGFANSKELTLAPPKEPLPDLTFDVDRVQKSNWIGSPFAELSIDDEIAEDRFLVGLIVGQGKEFQGAVQSVQGVYQKASQYLRGNRIGQPGGKESILLVPPGHVVVGISGMKGTQVYSLQLISAKMGPDGKVVRATQKTTPTVGVELGTSASIDTNGLPVVGIFGSSRGTSLTAVGLFAASKVSPSPSGPRKWTSRNGKSVVAEMLEATDTTVLLRKLDGKEVNVQLKDLSEGDQEWVARNR